LALFINWSALRAHAFFPYPSLFWISQVHIADTEVAMSSDMVANKVLNVLHRAKNPGIPSIPPTDPLPAEAGLTPAIAGEALGTPAAGAASQAQLNVITQLSGVIPWPPPDDPLQAVVAPAKLENTRKVIRQLSDQIKARQT
jgi:hypothetical protein